MLDIGPRLNHRPQEPLRSVASLLLRVAFDRLEELLRRVESRRGGGRTPRGWSGLKRRKLNVIHKRVLRRVAECLVGLSLHALRKD